MLAVHTDLNNEVWTARPGQCPRRTTLSPKGFADVAELDGVVRVIGAAQNSALLCRLYERCSVDNSCRIEVATPRLLSQASSPADTIDQIVQSRRFAASLGGWHTFTELDYPSYALHDALGAQFNCAPSDSAPWLALVAAHPAWRVAQFIPTLRPLFFARWVAEVRDPRWYIQPNDPDSTAPLERFLGLWPENQARIVKSPDVINTSAHGLRCWLTRGCWFLRERDEATQIDTNDPRNFLYRTFQSLAQRDAAIGLTRASQLFTRFVRAAWLDGLQKNTAQAGQLFDPTQFLKTAEELAAYAEYAASM